MQGQCTFINRAGAKYRDDHRILRGGIEQVLADAPDIQVVAEADTIPAILASVDALQGRLGLQVVLLDIALPGIDVLQALRKSWPRLPVLKLSAYPEKQYAVRCIGLGVSNYLNKSADPGDMIATVRKVASGGMYVSSATAEALASSLAYLSIKWGLDALSHREHQVYRLLTVGKSVGEIGAELALAGNTVSTYRARIPVKTGTRNDVELALYAHQRSKPDQ